MTEQILSQQYFDADGLTELYSEESLAESENLNHRVTALLDYKINKNNSIIWRSSASWQGNGIGIPCAPLHFAKHDEARFGAPGGFVGNAWVVRQEKKV